jgi:hypothetical protein
MRSFAIFTGIVIKKLVCNLARKDAKPDGRNDAKKALTLRRCESLRAIKFDHYLQPVHSLVKKKIYTFADCSVNRQPQ